MADGGNNRHGMTDDASLMRERIEAFVAGGEAPFRIYLNMTNGLQALPILGELGIEPRFVNIQSTALEQKNYDSVIDRLGPDVIMDCALGYRVAVVDYGTRKELSRAVYSGIPVVRYTMDRIWYGRRPDKVFQHMRSTRHEPLNIAGQLADIYERRLDAKSKAYIRRFSHYAASPETGVMLEGISIPTSHDGDAAYYAGIVREYVAGIPRGAGSEATG